MIKSVAKAIRIMNLFSAAEPRLSIAEISRQIGMPKSTTHNILKTLMADGFIERCSGDDYALGTAVVALSQKVRVNVEIRDRAAPLVRALADRCEESVYLTVREGAARALHLCGRILAAADRAHGDRRPRASALHRRRQGDPRPALRGRDPRGRRRGRPAARHRPHHDGRSTTSSPRRAATARARLLLRQPGERGRQFLHRRRDPRCPRRAARRLQHRRH